jgi:hypothetical protein
MEQTGACLSQAPGPATVMRKRPWAGVLGDPDLFFRSGFGDTLDQLMAQNIKGISILVERLYAG